MAAAPTRSHLASAAAVLLLLAGVAEARPCKTIFFSYTVTSFQPRPFSLRLPARDHAPDSFVFYRLEDPHPWPAFSVVAEPDPDSDPALPRPGDAAADDEKVLPFSLPRPLDGLGRLGGVGSLRDRTMDILYVVVALLLGVSCGLLTSAAVYLICSFVTYGRHGGEDSDDEEYERLDASGYVKIPDDPIKKGYEGN